MTTLSDLARALRVTELHCPYKRAALGMTRDVQPDEIDEDPPPPPDVYNPDRRLYSGEDFPVYYVLITPPDAAINCGTMTSDRDHAERGPHGFLEHRARDLFEDGLIDTLREDVKRLQAEAVTWAPDEQGPAEG